VLRDKKDSEIEGDRPQFYKLAQLMVPDAPELDVARTFFILNCIYRNRLKVLIKQVNL